MQDAQQDQPAKGKGAVDWDAIEPHWRAGIVSIAQLEREYGVSRTAIRKHFAKFGIERDQTAAIQGAATALVHRAEANGGQVPPATTTPPPGSVADVVGVNARVQAEVILRQRGDLRRGQRLCGELLTELESQTFDRTLYQRLDELMRKVGASGRPGSKEIAALQQLYARACTTGSRIENVRKLAEAMKVLTELERKVFGIADDTPTDPSERVKEAVKSGLSELRERFQARLQKPGAAA